MTADRAGWLLLTFMIGVVVGWFGFGYTPLAMEMNREITALDSLQGEAQSVLESAYQRLYVSESMVFQAGRCRDVRPYLEDSEN